MGKLSLIVNNSVKKAEGKKPEIKRNLKEEVLFSFYLDQNAKDESIDVTFETATRNVCILGGTGVGKTTTILYPIMKKLADSDCPGLIVDIKGGFSNLGQYLNEQTPGKCEILGTYVGCSPFNLIDGMNSFKFRELLKDVNNGLHKDNPFWGSNAIEDFVLMHRMLTFAYKDKSPNLADFYNLYANPGKLRILTDLVKDHFAEDVKQRLASDVFSIFSREKKDSDAQNQQTWQFSGLLNFLRPFSEDENIKHYFCSENSLDLKNLIYRDNKIVILDLPMAIYGETAIIAAKILRMGFKDTVKQQGESYLQSVGFGSEKFTFMLIDEYQQFVTTSSSVAIDDNNWFDISRGYGNINIISTQSVDSLISKSSVGYANQLLGNCRNIIHLATNAVSSLNHVGVLFGEDSRHLVKMGGGKVGLIYVGQDSKRQSRSVVFSLTKFKEGMDFFIKPENVKKILAFEKTKTIGIKENINLFEATLSEEDKSLWEYHLDKIDTFISKNQVDLNGDVWLNGNSFFNPQDDYYSWKMINNPKIVIKKRLNIILGRSVFIESGAQDLLNQFNDYMCCAGINFTDVKFYESSNSSRFPETYYLDNKEKEEFITILMMKSIDIQCDLIIRPAKVFSGKTNSYLCGLLSDEKIQELESNFEYVNKDQTMKKFNAFSNCVDMMIGILKHTLSKTAYNSLSLGFVDDEEEKNENEKNERLQQLQLNFSDSALKNVDLLLLENQQIAFDFYDEEVSGKSLEKNEFEILSDFDINSELLAILGEKENLENIELTPILLDESPNLSEDITIDIKQPLNLNNKVSYEIFLSNALGSSEENAPKILSKSMGNLYFNLLDDISQSIGSKFKIFQTMTPSSDASEENISKNKLLSASLIVQAIEVLIKYNDFDYSSESVDDSGLEEHFGFMSDIYLGNREDALKYLYQRDINPLFMGLSEFFKETENLTDVELVENK